MKLIITERAANFYKKEMDLNSGDILRLYVRVGGIGSGGFSIGIMHEQEWQALFLWNKAASYLL
ncbi:hypothetical protein [Bacillus sp. JCM 19041]|uniref:hypothetical protein n=1 Tax=Bacillus sp. JCM 19041 TaxID=1460637 RepID=UPI000ACA5672